jgi:hypothetical protein
VQIYKHATRREILWFYVHVCEDVSRAVCVTSDKAVFVRMRYEQEVVPSALSTMHWKCLVERSDMHQFCSFGTKWRWEMGTLHFCKDPYKCCLLLLPSSESCIASRHSPAVLLRRNSSISKSFSQELTASSPVMAGWSSNTITQCPEVGYCISRTMSRARNNAVKTLNIFIIIISNLSDDRSTASSKTIPPLNAI